MRFLHDMSSARLTSHTTNLYRSNQLQNDQVLLACHAIFRSQRTWLRDVGKRFFMLLLLYIWTGPVNFYQWHFDSTFLFIGILFNAHQKALSYFVTLYCTTLSKLSKTPNDIYNVAGFGWWSSYYYLILYTDSISIVDIQFLFTFLHTFLLVAVRRISLVMFA